MSDRSKKILLGVLAGVVLVGGGWWAYYKLTTIPPPDLASATGEEVVSYLGDSRGYARLGVDERQDYLVRVCQRYATGSDRENLNHALHRMTRSERQVFLDATFDVGRVRAVKLASEYNRLSNPREKTAFVDKAMRTFEEMRAPLSGAPVIGPNGQPTPPMANLGDAFRDDMPKGGDEMMKVIVSKTSSKERSEVKPLVDAIATRYKEKEARKRAQGS
jgi:hypothetical protein